MFSMSGTGASIRPESPLRAVKKMRGAAGEQVVRDWDVRGSPRNRRIVTRSNRDEDLVELEGEDVEDTGDVDDATPREEVLRVEIENEDGTIVEMNPQEGEAEEEDENWDDESMTEEAVWDATLMHLAETIGKPGNAPQQDNAEQAQDEGLQLFSANVDAEQTTPDATPTQDDTIPKDQLDSEPLPQQNRSPTKQLAKALEMPIPQLKSVLKQTSQFGAIPEGFVSPVKERQRRTINQVRLSNANRRRTLPVNFAAQNASASTTPALQEVEEDAPASESVVEVVKATQDSTLQHTGNVAEALVVPCEEASGADIQAALDEDDSDVELSVLPVDPEANHVDGVQVGAAHDENAWEDVDEDVPEQAEDDMDEKMTEQGQEVEGAAEALPSHEEQAQEEQQSVTEDAASTSPTNLDASAVKAIADPEPLSTLRRSPRRKSTSPVRRSGILPSSSKPHLVAFTPIKLPVYTSSVEFQSSPLPGADDSMEVDNPTPLPQPTRSSSAPPEEPQMSPRRPKQPRISDDTALLQAFLNRAAESKTSKDSSITAKRESMENRRDSTSVRQALASPAPLAKTVAGDVLADLDPNSPSPRKQALAASLAEGGQANGKAVADQDQDELALNATPDKKTSSRKSGRVKKKSSQALPASTYTAPTSAGPNRIAIRGADPVVVLKKSEAQEIAQMTRNNTKKNKSGAVLPPMRLTRLAAEKLARADEIAPPDEDDQMDVDVPVKTGRRAVKWAETLASFHEGANEPEMSMLSDELNVSEESSAPPASDTPSKPSKLRKLRTPRPTASSSGSNKASAEEAAPPTAPPAAEAAKPPRATKRSSRIATPAKLPGAAKSLLPDGLNDVEEPAPTSAAKKAPVTRKKAPSSKLPAPASSLTASTGKENTLIASPPKKKATAARTSTVPKLDFKGGLDAAPIIPPPSLGIAASPAKKGNGRAQVLFKENGDVSVKRDEPLGLASPAKKRSRGGL